MMTTIEFEGETEGMGYFVEDMLQRMRENRDKGGWSELEFDQLFGMLTRKVLEVHQAKNSMRQIYLCADVANYAFMIADNKAARIGNRPCPTCGQRI